MCVTGTVTVFQTGSALNSGEERRALAANRENLKKAGISRTGISMHRVCRCSPACREVQSHMTG